MCARILAGFCCLVLVFCVDALAFRSDVDHDIHIQNSMEPRFATRLKHLSSKHRASTSTRDLYDKSGPEEPWLGFDPVYEGEGEEKQGTVLTPEAASPAYENKKNFDWVAPLVSKNLENLKKAKLTLSYNMIIFRKEDKKIKVPYSLALSREKTKIHFLILKSNKDRQLYGIPHQWLRFTVRYSSPADLVKADEEEKAAQKHGYLEWIGGNGVENIGGLAFLLGVLSEVKRVFEAKDLLKLTLLQDEAAAECKGPTDKEVRVDHTALMLIKRGMTFYQNKLAKHPYDLMPVLAVKNFGEPNNAGLETMPVQIVPCVSKSDGAFAKYDPVKDTMAKPRTCAVVKSLNEAGRKKFCTAYVAANEFAESPADLDVFAPYLDEFKERTKEWTWRQVFNQAPTKDELIKRQMVPEFCAKMGHFLQQKFYAHAQAGFFNLFGGNRPDGDSREEAEDYFMLSPGVTLVDTNFQKIDPKHVSCQAELPHLHVVATQEEAKTDDAGEQKTQPKDAKATKKSSDLKLPSINAKASNTKTPSPNLPSVTKKPTPATGTSGVKTNTGTTLPSIHRRGVRV